MPGKYTTITNVKISARIIKIFVRFLQISESGKFFATILHQEDYIMLNDILYQMTMLQKNCQIGIFVRILQIF